MRCIPTDTAGITLGVDTHKDIHVAVALDGLGRRLGTLGIATNTGPTAPTSSNASVPTARLCFRNTGIVAPDVILPQPPLLRTADYWAVQDNGIA
jgi:hypothetical protein